MTKLTTFETWVKGRGGDVMKRDGEYLSSMTRLWWECWQAAVRSVETVTYPTMIASGKQPERDDYDWPAHDTIDPCRDLGGFNCAGEYRWPKKD